MSFNQSMNSDCIKKLLVPLREIKDLHQARVVIEAKLKIYTV